ncbi:hypothetical protein QR680_001413 [Steinernema hermaphroditum]|uniref:Golgi apparatus membrane protein TVP23 homolog n=1 Tax=Steinernema hermaphroditum TaxID=289476 RepID=A0AA39LFZ7_9BILA|nr:hypothetical protein QR680_001413 [Steinernema hermaphroditum]
MASGFDSAPIFGEESTGTRFSQFKSLRNPPIVVAHIGFRSAAIFSYVFANLFFDSFIIQFLAILFLLSADFWFVKNITGRLLGETIGSSSVLRIPTALWFMLVIIAFLTFKWEWMVVAFLGFVMNGLNLYGYLRCKWNSTEELTNYLSRMAFISMLRRSTNQPPPPHRPAEVA